MKKKSLVLALAVLISAGLVCWALSPQLAESVVGRP